LGVLRTVSNHNLSFRANNTDYMILTTGGKVGIGTTSPLTKLVVKDGNSNFEVSGVLGGITLEAIDRATATSNDFNLYTYNGAVKFFTAGFERFRISNGGNVGIQTTAPLATLSVGSRSNISLTNNATDF